jgi:hypothetical protein
MKNRIAYALIVAAAGSIALAGCKKPEPAAAPTPAPEATAPTPAPVTPAPAPAPTTSYTVSAATAKDPIVVTVTTDASVPANASLVAKLTYQDGQTAGEQNTTIKAEDAGTTKITFTKTSPWPAGNYTVDLTLNGAPVGTPQTVTIK